MSEIKLPDGWVLVDRGALNMVINALRRDAEEGRQVRGEMADLLSAAPATPQPAAQQGDEREAFDQWFRGYQFLPDDADTTQYDEAFLAFKAWQARAALTAQAQEAAPAAQAELSGTPWSDLKVAFDVENEDALWAAWDAGSLTLPSGWSLNETDCSFARCVAVFRVDHAPTIAEGKAVADTIKRLDREAQQKGARNE